MSTTGKKRDTYHHGSLRTELTEASVRLIEAEGIGAVSLRRVAREAGVSPGAPYHHFPNRAALLSAIAAQGFRELTADIDAVDRDTLTGAAPALVRCYLEFARRRPGHFQVMWRHELSEPEKHPEVLAAMQDAFGALARLLHDVDAPEPAGLGTALWALGHGLASLTLDHQLDHTAHKWDTTADDLVERCLALVSGLAGR